MRCRHCAVCMDLGVESYVCLLSLFHHSILFISSEICRVQLARVLSRACRRAPPARW